MTTASAFPRSSEPNVLSAIARSLATRRRVMRARLLAPDCGASEALALFEKIAQVERELGLR